MTQTPQYKLKRGCPVIMPSGLVTELTDIQHEHNRYQIEDVSGWQYGIENLQPAEWKLEAQKWRREALQKYPTPEAYEGVCAALEKHRARADAAEDRVKELEAIIKAANDENERLLNGEGDEAYAEAWATLYPDTPAQPVSPGEEGTVIRWSEFHMHGEPLKEKTYLILANGLAHQAKYDPENKWFYHEGYEADTIYFQNTVSHYADFNYPSQPAAPAPEITARPIDEWHEDYGDVLWWEFPVCEPPYCGTPIDVDWPGYHTRWTPIVIPASPAPKEGDHE